MSWPSWGYEITCGEFITSKIAKQEDSVEAPHGPRRVRDLIDTRLLELQLQGGLKQKIIALARVFYVPLYPIGTTFDVITIVNNKNNICHYVACVVAYTEIRNPVSWICLKCDKEDPSFDSIDALDKLLLQTQLLDSNERADMKEGRGAWKLVQKWQCGT